LPRSIENAREIMGAADPGRLHSSCLPDVGLQERLASAGIAVTDFRRSFAVALAVFLDAASMAKFWPGSLEPPHRLAADHFTQPGFVDSKKG